jgi:cell division septal protein FtsQ
MDKTKVFEPSHSKYFVFTTDYLLPTFISLAVLTLVYLVFYSSFFQIKQVVCHSDYQECKDVSLIAELDKLKGQNIFTLNQNQVASRLTSGNFMIREVTVNKELPTTIKLDLASIYPVVALQVLGDSNWIVLDGQYRVIGTRSTDPNVVTITLQSPLTLTIGKPISDPHILAGLKLGKLFSDELLNVKSITLLDNQIIEVKLPDGKLALFTTEKDFTVQLRALQAILGNATIIKGVQTIDVRFSQPVLR